MFAVDNAKVIYSTFMDFQFGLSSPGNPYTSSHIVLPRTILSGIREYRMPVIGDKLAEGLQNQIVLSAAHHYIYIKKGYDENHLHKIIEDFSTQPSITDLNENTAQKEEVTFIIKFSKDYKKTEAIIRKHWGILKTDPTLRNIIGEKPRFIYRKPKTLSQYITSSVINPPETATPAQDDGADGQSSSCTKEATKFKHARKYTYNYEAVTSSEVTGTADSQSGSKLSCKVELEVPQPCNFILRIKQCTLKEVFGVNPEGKALFKVSKSSEDFSIAMSKYEINFSVVDGKQVILYPNNDEPVNILNMKRGIISSLLAPDETQETSSMDTVYGKCTSVVSSSGKKGSSDFTVTRNLKTCDQFTPFRDYVSPLALFKGLNAPLSTLLSSSQSCQYNLDSKRKHITKVLCKETHLFLPFSYKNKYGMSAKVTQELVLEETSKINSREFADSPQIKGLALEASQYQSGSEDVVMDNLLELQKISTSEQNQQRANRFHKLVTALRTLRNESLGPLVPRLMEMSSSITLQALTQCGTPECFGAILQVLRTGNMCPVLTDAVTYALGLLPSPCTKRVRELLNMAQYQQSRASFYALSHAVNNFYEERKTITPELRDVADFMTSLIGDECSGDQDKTFLTLKAVGIMGIALEEASSQIKSSVLKCVRNPAASLDVQKAAIKALRKMTVTDDVRSSLVQVFQDNNSPVQKRLSAYLILMKNPSQSDLRKVVRVLTKDDNVQLKNFVASHIVNILNSQEADTQLLKAKLEESLKSSGVPSVVSDFSRNYQYSKTLDIPGLNDNLGAKVEGNLVYDSSGYMPREVMLRETLNVFGSSVDMFEIGIEGKGFEPTLDALFGKGGFFPDSAAKALYWANGKVPDRISQVLYKWFGVSKQDMPTEDLKKAILFNAEKMIKEVKSSNAPEAQAYLEILGKELGYVKLSDFRMLGNMMLKNAHSLQDLPAKIMQAFSAGADGDLFVHYIFMDNQFYLPTGSGLQLQVSLAGVIAPGTRSGMKFGSKNIKAELSVNPAIAVEFVTQLAIQIPEFSKHAVQMNTNIYHESGVQARFSVSNGQVKFSVPAPTSPTKIFSINNKINLVFASKTEVMPSIIENREEHTSCKPLITGMQFCTSIGYSNASTIDSAPYFPLTGEARYELELRPTGQVKEYSLTASYNLKREGTDLVDTLQVSTQAEGVETSEAALIVKYNRNKIILTSSLEVPSANVNLGTSLRFNDDSNDFMRIFKVTAELTNQQVSEVTLIGKLSYDGATQAVASGLLTIPKLNVEASTEVNLKRVHNNYELQIQSSAKICALSGSQRLAFTYDDNKVQLQWDTTSNSNVKKILSRLPEFQFNDPSNYPEAVQTYANNVLDYKVAQTDMTLRHILSQSVVASNNWLKKTSKDSQYAQTIRNKLTALKEMNLKELGIPPIPDDLFLNSGGMIKYTFNKDSITINIPLPYGGKSSHQVVPKTLRSPPLELQSVGFYFPHQEFRVPAFTIPEYYQLRVPLIGVLELTSSINSNYYNWSVTYSGGNTTTDVYKFSSRYQMQADAILDLLSYSIEASTVTTYDPMKTLSLTYEGSLSHTLLQSSMRLSEEYNLKNKEIFKGYLSYQARSVLGLDTSGALSSKSSMSNSIVTTEVEANERLAVASVFANSDFRLLTTLNVDNFQAKADSNFRFDSSFLKFTNKMASMLLTEAVTVTSTTDLLDGAVVNTINLDYRNKQLTLKSDTNGNYYNLVGLNKLEVTLSKQMAAIRSECQATYKRNRFYTLVSGSLNSLGLEINTDVTLNNQQSRAAHKATLKLNQEGLSTSATTSVNFNPLMLESEINAGIGYSGAVMKMMANGRYREHSAKISVDGKAAMTELSLGSVYQATILGMDSKHLLNFRISKEGLKFSNNLMASYDQIKLENSNDLSIVGSVLEFTSKFENTLTADKFHKHRFDFQIQPYTIKSQLNNELQYGALELNNRGLLQVEAFKLNINGNVRGAFKRDEIKHSYGFTVGDLTASLNTDTLANIQGAAHTHRFSLEIAGLSASVSSNTNCETKSMRFTNRIRSVVEPFTVTIDSQTNADGRLLIFGEQSGQLYSKFILKAEALSFNLVHDYRGSTSHSFGAGNTHNTLLDYKINVLFTPAEQLSSLKLKSSLNQNTYNQEFNAFNNADGIGIEVQSQALADLSIMDKEINLSFAKFNPIDALSLRDTINTPQEFSISGYIKYDKNKDMHVISLPFIENMSLYFEKIKSSLLHCLQALQNSLKEVNIDQYVQRYRRALDTASQKVNNYINDMEMEEKVRVAKENLLALTKEFKITADEVQAAIEDYFRRVQHRLQLILHDIDQYIRESYDIEQLKRSLEMFIKKCVDKIKALDADYRVREKILDMIQNVRELVEKINIDELGQSVAAWIQNVDDLYQIRASLQRLLQQMQIYVQKVDFDQMADNMKELLKSLEISRYIEEIQNILPIQKLRIILENIKNLVATQLEEFDISDKLNAVVNKLQDIVTNYELNKKIEVLIEKSVEFLNQQKVRETVKKLTEMLNNIDISLYYNKVQSFVDSTVKQLRDYDFKKLINDINYYLDIVIQKMRSFKYDIFVDDFNIWIKETTKKLNDKMRALELPQKAEALRQYLNNIRVVITEYVQKVKDTRLAAVMQWYQDIMTSTVVKEWMTRTIDILEDYRHRIYSINIQRECQKYLQQVSQAYTQFLMFVTEQWNLVASKMTKFAEENKIQEWADKMKLFVEEGFVVPEIKLGFIHILPFEVSLRALREATFRTPHITVPFTDLQIKSVEINFRKLRDIEIPTRYVTPEFTVLNRYKVPSYVIDLQEIKLTFVRIIDQILSSDYKWPSPDVFLRDITMSDMGLPEFSIPEIYIPDMQLSEYKIPKLNLENFRFPEIQIPDFQLPKIPHTVSVPTFGKLSSSFKIISPFFTMLTVAEARNATVSEKSPEFIASFKAETTSIIRVLAFTFDADARVSAPLLEQLNLKETVSLAHDNVKLDHSSEVSFLSNNIQTQVKTNVNLMTEKNSVELQNSILLKIQRRIMADVTTKYSHRLNIPQLDFSSQLDLQNDIDTTVDFGRINLISSGKGNWKWACRSLEDEGTHEADLKFNLKGGNIELSGTNKINAKYLKLDQTLKYDSVFLNSVTFEIMSKADAPSIGNSIATLKGRGQVSEMKIEVEARHNAELVGQTTGTVNNNFEFLLKAFEIKLSTANNGNLKISFPLKLTGKIDFLNNYDLTLNPNVQLVSWQTNGRFNQYKISKTISLGNNDENIEAVLTMNGEANLDFLTVPVSVPEIKVPYTSYKTPAVRDFSLWERTGLKKLLTSPRQNFDLNIKLQYQKNKEMHAIPLPLDTLLDSINVNLRTMNKKFESGRDKVLNILVDSYNQAKAKFDKYKVDNQVSKISRTFRIPGYTIPLLNIEVSPYTAELPAIGYIVPKEINTPNFKVPVIGFSVPTYKLVLPSPELPVLHIPNSLRRLSLPKVKLPTGQNSILIPAMGNLTYDFFFKSNVISLTTSAGIYNQSDISARVSIASTSVIDALQFNLDATTGLTRKRGLKLATALALKSVFAEGKHESSVSFGKRNIEASVITNAKMDSYLIKSTLKQELNGNTKTKPTVTSKISLTYDLNEPLFENAAKGKLDHSLNLEGLTSYFSLETQTSGDISGTLLSNQMFSGMFNNEANTYLNANGLRSSVRLVSNSRADGLGNLDFTENFAVESSTGRIFALWEHKGENYYRITPLFTSKGKQSSKATLELALWSLLADLQVQIEQPNSFIETASLNQEVSLALNTEKQEFSVKGHGILESLVAAHNFQISNDQSDSRVEVGGSLQGHMDFLKSIILPVYKRSLWDVLRLDVTTSPDKKQYLNASTTLIYTKSNDGAFYPFSSDMLGTGFTKNFPGFTLPKDAPLPSSFPEIQFPAVPINFKYTEDSKLSYVELSVPKYQITLSKYTIPKTFYNLDFNSMFNKIADIDLPTIEIPEQNIVVPPVKLRMPAGLYIPAFGALSGSVQVLSPVYNLTWTNKLEKKTEGLVETIDATSSSTLRFLEFDLDASVIGSVNGRVLNIIGQGSLAHVDLSAVWKEQATFDGLWMQSHNIEVDLTSPTFTNAQIRCQHDENGISSSISSTSSGTLGLQVEKDSKTIKLRVYSRSLASPGKETLILKNEISLKNPERIQNKLNWREEAAQDVLNGLKERLPKMSDAIYNCVNKYHQEHLGMEMKDASRLLKEQLQSEVSSMYKSTSQQIDKMEYQLRTAARGASGKYVELVNKAQQLYQQPPDMSLYLRDDGQIYDKSITVIRGYQNTMKDVIDAAVTFLKSTKFQLPGQTQRYTGEEQFAMGMKWATSTIETCIQKIQQFLDGIIQSFNNINIKLPGTNTVIEGRQVTMAIKEFLQNLQQIAKKIIADLQYFSLERNLQQLKSLIQDASQKSEKLIEALKSKNYEDIKLQTQQMYNDAVSSKFVQYVNSLAEKIEKSTSSLAPIFQKVYKELSEKLKQLLIYVKALREEYLDPNIVGWSVKYYEIEEKVIELFRFIIDSLKELPSKYGVNMSEYADTMKEYYEQARVLATNAEDKGRRQVRELSMKMEEKVSEWSSAARKAVAEHSQNLNAKLHEAHSQLLLSYDKFLVEAKNLIDLAIQKYNAFIEFITQMLQNLQNSASEGMKTYMSTRKGELKLDVPHPFDWKSFDEVPHVRSDIISKRVEIVRSMVLEGIDKSSKKWEELQIFMEKQLEDGKLSAQQIIENIRNWKKN
ncbi:apolipoprotein B-100 [Gastrophryne carolinensis]